MGVSKDEYINMCNNQINRVSVLERKNELLNLEITRLNLEITRLNLEIKELKNEEANL